MCPLSEWMCAIYVLYFPMTSSHGASLVSFKHESSSIGICIWLHWRWNEHNTRNSCGLAEDGALVTVIFGWERQMQMLQLSSTLRPPNACCCVLQSTHKRPLWQFFFLLHDFICNRRPFLNIDMFIIPGHNNVLCGNGSWDFTYMDLLDVRQKLNWAHWPFPVQSMLKFCRKLKTYTFWSTVEWSNAIKTRD